MNFLCVFITEYIGINLPYVNRGLIVTFIPLIKTCIFAEDKNENKIDINVVDSSTTNSVQLMRSEEVINYMVASTKQQFSFILDHVHKIRVRSS